MSDDLAVRAAGLTKRYGDATVLDGVDIEVRPGHIHGLLGPNGAGKTTTLSILLGLVLPDEGTVELFGREQFDAGADWLAGVGGFVEAPTFYPYLTGTQNLRVLAHLDRAGAAPPVAEVLELVGLRDAAGRKVRGYSLGMRQRLGLAAALLRRPRLLVVDEPTNGMDPGAIRDLRAALRRRADAGLAVILSSHDISQVEEICDEVTILDRGAVAWAGSMEALRSESPDPEWDLRTTDDVAAAAAASEMEDVKVTPTGAGVRLVGSQARLDQLIEGLVGAGVGIRQLVLQRTPLEARFFELTRGGSALDGQGRPR